MNKNAWDVGRCGYCGIRFEEFDTNHTAKCKKIHDKYIESIDQTHQLKRIADALEKKGAAK